VQKHFYFAIFLVAISCCICFCFIEARATDTATAINIDTALSQLEDRFFEHQYDSDTDLDRLNRIEDFVYGSHHTGSIDRRIKHILFTIPDEENDQTAQITPVTPISPVTPVLPTSNHITKPAPQSKSSAATTDTKQAQTSQPPHSSPFDFGSYPRVTNLEQELLGHTYTNDSLPDRLKRLETKAYGAPSSSSDLCQRVDLLDDYAQRHDLYREHQSVSSPSTAFTFNPTTPVSHYNANAQEQPSTDPSYPWPSSTQQPYTSNSGTFVGSAEERVSMMEAQVFNRTYPDKTLDQRLKKLAKKILPNQDIANLPPAEQTVQLWDTLHPNEKNQVASLAANASQPSDTTANTTNNDIASANVNKRGSWLHRLANAGGSFAGTSMGPSSGMQTTYGTNAPYYGLGIPGSGLPGYGNSRFIGASVGPGAGPAGLPIGFW